MKNFFGFLFMKQTLNSYKQRVYTNRETNNSFHVFTLCQMGTPNNKAIVTVPRNGLNMAAYVI